MFNTLSTTQKGMFLSAFGYAGFFLSDINVKLLSSTYSIYQIVMTIMALAAVFMLLASPKIKQGQPLFKTDKPKLHILRGVLNLLVGLVFIAALAQLPMASVYAMIFAQPFFAVLLTLLIYKERVSLNRWLVIGVGFIGILIAMRPSGAGFDLALTLPLLAAIFASLLFVVSKSMTGESIFKLGFYPAVITAVLVAPLAWPSLTMIALPDIPFFLMSGAGVAMGLTLVSMAYTKAAAAVVSPFQYTQMIWGIVFGFLVFGDVPDLYTLIGAAVIIGSGLYLVWSERV